MVAATMTTPTTRIRRRDAARHRAAAAGQRAKSLPNLSAGPMTLRHSTPEPAISQRAHGPAARGASGEPYMVATHSQKA